LARVLEYVGNPDLIIVHNKKKVQVQEFGKERVVKESTIENQQWDLNIPSFIDS